MTPDPPGARTATWRSALDTLATVLFIAVCTVVIWTSITKSGPVVGPAGLAAVGANRANLRIPEPILPPQPIPLDGAATEGSKAARIGLLMYSDFQCPFCAKFARETLPGIRKHVTSGKVLIAFRQFPLPNHPLAAKAAEASECAGRQGRFWEMHDSLFQNPQELDLAALRRRARSISLHIKQFDGCLEGAVEAKVTQDAVTGKKLMVTGTPTFFVGVIGPDGALKVTERLTGAQPLVRFEAAFDRALRSDTQSGEGLVPGGKRGQ